MLHWIKSSDGKEYPLKFSQSVINIFVAHEKVPANQVGTFLSGFGSWPMDRVYRFYHLAFKAGARNQNKEFDMTDDEFIEFLEDDPALFPQVIEAFSASNPEQKKTQKKPGSR